MPPYKDTSQKRIKNALPIIVKSVDGFEPSNLMIQVLLKHLQGLENKEVKSPYKILQELNRSVSNWSLWKRRSAGFIKWWREAMIDWHETMGLHLVYDAMFDWATMNSPQDRKLYLERFDKEYKPQTAQEHKFPGMMPPESEQAAAIERSRKRVDSTEQQQKQIEGGE